MAAKAVAGTGAASHWAFQPIRPVEPPELSDPWVRTPVDAFILKRLRDRGLAPAGEAPAREFVRRAHLTLIGLSPPFGSVDGPHDAVDVEQLIDRLLASPQFGVRWARHWLDVARYSDTKGYAYAVEQSEFYHAWRYRDWVVDAVNADLPYDAFLERQIAADRLLLEGKCDTRDLAAMGFLTMGRRFLGVEQDIVDDRIDVVTRGLLGLTAACARCHDHKFDPIPIADYYALYGIFKSSPERVTSLQPDPADDAELEKLHEAYAALFNKEADAAEKTFLARVDEYLVAALDLSTVPPPAFTEIVRADAVNPAQIRRWHEFLNQSIRDTDPIFAPWKALGDVPPDKFSRTLTSLKEGKLEVNSVVLAKLEGVATMKEVALRYAELFKAAKGGQGEGWDAIRQSMKAPGSPFLIPREHPHDVEWLFHNGPHTAVKKAFASYERRLVALRENAAYAVTLGDRPVPVNMPVLKRGDYLNQGGEAPRGTLSLLPGAGLRIESGSGRLEFAKSITDPMNPLTARIIVNRLWHHYFGTGLVRTNSDFGSRAEPPSHPGLLDYLAGYLIENGWSLKAVHRMIAQSATFRQQAGQPGAADPENRLLSVYPRRRLDFEAMRDGLLAVSGELDLRLGGAPGELLGMAPSPRRSLYGRVDRKFLPTELRVFDFANPELHSPKRYETNVPQQALFFLNSPFTIDRARKLADRLGDSSPEAKARRLFQFAYHRNPTPEEVTASLDFVAHGSEPAEPAVESPWRYGYGKYDQGAGRIERFTRLPHFGAGRWSGGPEYPKSELGWLSLTEEGGHAGHTRRHAAVRRWIAPDDTQVSISGTVGKSEKCGDGLRVFISAGGKTLAALQVEFGTEQEAHVENIAVRKGDAIDFVVDCGENDDFSCDGFLWSIHIASTAGAKWDSTREFGGEAGTAERLTPWERLAHALLLSNEFLFID